jgi:hypothetical protein
MWMMKRDNLKSLGCAMVICCAILLFCSSAQAAGQEYGASLMLESTPAEGGYLNIKSGVHTFDLYAEVALKATPKPGYQFDCWLGSVSESSHSSTSVYLDSPKMVIAVFERTKFEMAGIEEVEDGVSGGASSGGRVRSAGLSDSSLEQAVGGVPPSRPSGPHIPHNVPVPGKEVPEPATIAILSAGLLILVNRRRKGVNLTDKM